MKEREYLLNLYEIYNKLLTPREKNYFEYYYFEDYSLQEIADNYDVSRSYVGKYLNGIEKKLNKYEEALNLYKRNNSIRSIISDCSSDVKNKIEELL